MPKGRRDTGSLDKALAAFGAALADEQSDAPAEALVAILAFGLETLDRIATALEALAEQRAD